MKQKPRKAFLKIYRAFVLFGFDPVKTCSTWRSLVFYFRTYRALKKQKGTDTSFVFGRNYAILNERFEEAGTMSGHYFHQDLHVARRIFGENPARHIDIGSRTDGFVAHVAVFREIEIIDIRAQQSKVRNILFRQADLMQLPESLLNSCESISSLHAIEHFGLGRYGDPIDYNGHLKAIRNITAMLKPGGTFYFSTPIGPQRIEFNAQRVFSVSYLLDILEQDYELKAFSYVDDNGAFFEHAAVSPALVAANFGCEFGCGIFELVKK